MQKKQSKPPRAEAKRNTKRQRIGGAPVLSRTVEDSASHAGVGRSAIREAMKAGVLKARKLGRRTLILDDDLRAWITGLPAA